MDRSSDEARKWFRRCAWRDYAYWQLGFQLERVNQVYFSNDTDGLWLFAGVGGEASMSVEDWMCFFFVARMLHYWPSLPEEAMRMVSWQILVGTKAFIEKTQSKTRNHETWQRYIHGALSWWLKISDCQSCLLHYCMLLHAILPYLALKLTYIMMVFYDFSIFLIIFALPPMVWNWSLNGLQRPFVKCSGYVAQKTMQ